MSERKYKTLNYPFATIGSKTLLTGIREVKHHHKKEKVYISGFYEPSSNDDDQQIKSFVYKGYLSGKGKWYELYFPGAETTNLYGPNNGHYKNTIQVVGNYVNPNETNPIGCLYEGPLNGSGKWTTLMPPGSIKTIAHSTMGGLIVGNCQTENNYLSKAFIYDIRKKRYYYVTENVTNSVTDTDTENTESITAYGIWHNGDKSYTICGGIKSNDGTEAGYLVDWNNDTKKLTNWREYHYDNNPIKSRITHFDGISGNKKYYTLTGDWVGKSDGKKDRKNTKLGFFATVKRKRNTKWEDISYPIKDSITSGNTVYKNNVIGVYTSPTLLPQINGYISRK